MKIKYLVLGQDGNLYGYQREDILLCDIAEHKRDSEPHQTIFAAQLGLITWYSPITVEELQDIERAAKAPMATEMVA